MEKFRKTAGETASKYPKRVRMFSPDGHANNDIITTVDDIYTERFVRAHARRIGWRISVRMIKEGGAR
jgi:hypothetical protein